MKSGVEAGGFDATVQRQKEKPEERTLEIFGVLNVKSYRSRSRHSNGVATKSSDSRGNFVPLRVNFLTIKGNATPTITMEELMSLEGEGIDLEGV